MHGLAAALLACVVGTVLRERFLRCATRGKALSHCVLTLSLFIAVSVSAETALSEPVACRGCVRQVLIVTIADATKPLPAVDEIRPARADPLNPSELGEFLETVVRGQALDQFCPNLFNRDQKAAIYLAYRWGKSVAMTDAYPPSLFLNTISTKAEYMRLMENRDCAEPRLQRTRDQYDTFLRQQLPNIRMSEIR